VRPFPSGARAADADLHIHGEPLADDSLRQRNRYAGEDQGGSGPELSLDPVAVS
jgi:hypothetical protein